MLSPTRDVIQWQSVKHIVCCRLLGVAPASSSNPDTYHQHQTTTGVLLLYWDPYSLPSQVKMHFYLFLVCESRKTLFIRILFRKNVSTITLSHVAHNQNVTAQFEYSLSRLIYMWHKSCCQCFQPPQKSWRYSMSIEHKLPVEFIFLRYLNLLQSHLFPCRRANVLVRQRTTRNIAGVYRQVPSAAIICVLIVLVYTFNSIFYLRLIEVKKVIFSF